MPRGNRKNLIPANERSKEEAIENSRKGGIASGKARREKSDLRKAIQMALNNSYADKDGNMISGTEAMARNLVAKALSKNSRDAMAAIKYICELTGMNKTAEQLQKERVELKLLEKELELKKQVVTDMKENTDNEIRIEIVRANKKPTEDKQEENE